MDRKAALRAYKERVIRRGIHGVRDRETGRTWPGSANDLDSTKNGLWHTLESGRHLDKELQAEWTRFGEERFEYVVLEVLEGEMSPLVLKETLKERKAHWEKTMAVRA
jgi:hypothetical protein